MVVICLVIAACSLLFALVLRGQVVSLRKSLAQYADRMEAAERDLHAIRSVVSNRLNTTASELNAMLAKPDADYLAALSEDLLAVQHIVETRGPATINGRPWWHAEPQENGYQYGPQYPMFPE